MEKQLAVADTTSPVSGAGRPTQFAAECWFDDSCILDMDYFVKTLSGIKAKGVRPDLIGSIITHYASKWLPDLDQPISDNIHHSALTLHESPGSSNITRTNYHQQQQVTPSEISVTAGWMKKRFFVETLVGILPPERDSIPCNFLLRLLRVANAVEVELTYRTELEKRIALHLDQASLGELMIPSFSHTCATLLDVELVLRVVNRFVYLDEAVRGGAALIKVAKLVDSYLAEAAVDSNLTLSEFIGLAGALPSHARAMDDGLYRAVDTYLKAHPGITKQEKKSLCRLIDCRKLTPEASVHASQNERLPVRAVIQVLFSEQTKLVNRHIDWSESFSASGTRSPSNPGLGVEPPSRCLSKREISAQHTEIKKLKEDVLRLQSQCFGLQAQIDRLTEKKRGSLFSWKKMVVPSFKVAITTATTGSVSKMDGGDLGEREVGFGRQTTPSDMKTRLVRGRTTTKWRRSSMS